MSRTVLLGLDGATFSILDPLMDEGVMPFLNEFTSRGVKAELMSTALPLTAQAWPSLMTGRAPGNHGVFDFVRVDPGVEHPTYRLATSTDVSCETIWSIAGRQGRRVACLNFPLMFPPQALNGYMVPGFVPWRHLRRAVHPPELYGELKALPGFDPQELALDYDLEKRAIQRLPDDEYEDWIRLHIRRELQWFQIASSLMRREPLDLVAVLFDGVDKLQHACWRFLNADLFPEAPSAWESTVRHLCLEYFRTLDGHLAEIVALAGEDTRVFIASDHGFGATDQIFFANTWLAQEGYLAWREGVPVDTEGMLHTEGHRSTIVLFDWTRTFAYALTPSSNGIFIKRALHPGDAGIPHEDYLAFRKRLAESLCSLTDPTTGEPVVRQVLTREEAFPGAKMEAAPDLTVILRDHGFISVVRADAPVKRRTRVEGTHRPEGIFLAGGTGVRAGVSTSSLSILDVAPTLLYSLGLPVPADLEGRLPEEIFEPTLRETVPSRTGEPTLPAAGGTFAREPMSPEGEAQVLERLRALGYLE